MDMQWRDDVMLASKDVSAPSQGVHKISLAIYKNTVSNTAKLLTAIGNVFRPSKLLTPGEDEISPTHVASLGLLPYGSKSVGSEETEMDKQMLECAPLYLMRNVMRGVQQCLPPADTMQVLVCGMSGVSPKEFSEHLSQLPYLPSCTKPICTGVERASGELEDDDAGFFPAPAGSITVDVLNRTRRMRPMKGVMYYIEDLSDLRFVDTNCFDLVISFGMTNTGSRGIHPLTQKMQEVLKPRGLLVGTGLFIADGKHDVEDDTMVDGITLKGFSEATENAGLRMHTMSDLSLEGRLAVQIDHTKIVKEDKEWFKNEADELEEMLRDGSLSAMRFVYSRCRVDTHAPSVIPDDADVIDEVPASPVAVEEVREHAEKLQEAIFINSEEPLPMQPISPEQLYRADSAEEEQGDDDSETRGSGLSSSSSVSSIKGLLLRADAEYNARSTASSTPPRRVGSRRNLAMSDAEADSLWLDRLDRESVFMDPRTMASLRLDLDRDYDNIGFDEEVYVSGVSMGLPNEMFPERRVFDENNFDYVFNGENFIQRLTDEEISEILDMNIVKISKKDGKRISHSLNTADECIKLMSKLGKFDLVEEYGVPAFIIPSLDTTYSLAIAAGLEALRDAGIELKKYPNFTAPFALPESMRDETGIIFASSFPALDSSIEEATKKCLNSNSMKPSSSSSTSSSSKSSLSSSSSLPSSSEKKDPYVYNRKLLFKLLVKANCQLAELIGARGPNTQTNAACASTTQAIVMAEDWIRAGRCKRVVVVSADNTSNDTMRKYVGTGFLALGAASIKGDVSEAAVPFDLRRKGMILGCGACGMVIESASACSEREGQPKAEIMGSHISNSAFHAALLDKAHIASEFKTFLSKTAMKHSLNLDEVANDCVYYSHETCTSANGGCAQAEVEALTAAFGEEGKANIIIANLKSLTGHPMGVGFEDVVAVEGLHTGRVPPIVNNKETDERLGDLMLSQGGYYNKKYALRFAAGFGSQLALLLFRKCENMGELDEGEENEESES